MKTALLLAAFCFTAPDTGRLVTPRTAEISYGCGDIVVLGRLKNNRDYEHVEIEDDLLGHGWMTARVNIGELLKGREWRGTVPVRYFGHTYLREDRDFVVVLSPGERNGYVVRTASLLEDRSTLASHCLPPDRLPPGSE
jgi:hypothetical protein